MVYNLRNRENMTRVLLSSSSEYESEHSSTYRPERKPAGTRSRQRNSEETTGIQMEVPETASSSRMVNITGRKRGRPSKKRDNEEGERQIIRVPQEARGTRSRRRKASFPIRLTPPSQLHKTVLSWLIDSEIVKENSKIWFMDQTHERVMLEGAITRAGISCNCCGEVITVWEFGKHAGSDDLKKPYQNILIANTRVSLLSCQIQAWKQQVAPERHGYHHIEPVEGVADQHDDACMVCSDGGNLICCDQCPSTFHHTCMDMEMIPQGAWYCPYCVCKFCGFCADGKDDLLKCFQCEKKYHRECCQVREERVIDLNRPCTTSFCEQSCREIFEKLEKIVGVRNELDDGLSWTLLRRMDPDSGVYIDDLHHRTECNSKIAIAWSVMEESFTSTADRQTQINLIQSTVYNCGSNYTRINFSSFYTAILERDEEIISAASVRIHGTRLAEMPFVATRWIYRDRGMCHKLLIAIESALCFLKVENLVIPSIHSRISKWIDRYGFNHLEDSMKKEIFYFNTLMFHSAVRLQKLLLTRAAEPEIAAKAMEVDEAKNNGYQNGLGSENKSTKPALLDLNLEPPEDDEIKI